MTEQETQQLPESGETQPQPSGKFIGFWHYGVILTYLSAIAAIIGIFYSAQGRSGVGVICLLISGFCDAFDGAVASTRKRRTKADKFFGGQIDSLSDLVAFGIAPVMIGYGLGMRKWYYYIIFAIYMLCALIRLAYYNVTEMQRSEEGAGKRTSFEGLPVTISAIIMTVAWLIALMIIEYADMLAAHLFFAAVYLVVAFLFIFRFRFPKASPKQLIVVLAVLAVVLGVLFSVDKFAIHVL